MASRLVTLGLTVVILVAVAYQTFIKSLLFVTIGLGRDLQPISDFPYRCRRIQDPRLQACEDLWLSENTRQLFLACSDPASRKQWFPNVGRLNASGRGLDDAVIAMDIDKPNGQSFEYRTLRTTDFSGVYGDGRLHLVGLTGLDGLESIQLYLINARPSVNSTTVEELDNKQIGGNSTIEVFEVGPNAEVLKHLKTYAHTQISTPNNIAVLGPEEFVFTNDHGPYKAGIQHELSPLISTGDVSLCNATACSIKATRLAFPNGLTRGADGKIYVPSAWAGGITVFQTQVDKPFKKVDYIDIPYPIDNLKLDANGDIIAAAMPKALVTLASFDDPVNIVPPSTIFRVRQAVNEEGWIVDKVLEDGNSEILPGATAAVHDAKTGRIFVVGAVAPFISVCDPI